MKAQLKRAWCHRHLLLGYMWIVLAIPALIWWKNSVLFVILLSLYANAWTSFSTYHAKQAADRERMRDDAVDPCDTEEGCA
jgi:hypothetical protein